MTVALLTHTAHYIFPDPSPPWSSDAKACIHVFVPVGALVATFTTADDTATSRIRLQLFFGDLMSIEYPLGNQMAVEENKGTGEVQESIGVVIVCSEVADTTKQQHGKVEGDQEKEGEQKEKETKKRKAYTSRSDVWESYVKIKIGDELKKARCKFCNRELLCDPKRNGTLQVQPIKGDGSRGTISTWKFDLEDLKNTFAEMIIEDELPFAFCEHPGFRRFMAKACPRFIVPSRRTTTRIVAARCEVQKEKLKEFFKNYERVSLTTDIWTSNTHQSYMCVTTHFIDDDWKLRKKIIGFFLVKGHKGEDIGKSLEQCLLRWGLDKVFTITVDNASANDGAVNYMRKVLNNSECSIAEVTDGLKEVDVSITRIRAAVKYIKNSTSRLDKFKKYAELAKVDSEAFLRLDVCTRWNSTYLMLHSAIVYEKAFPRYDEEDPYYALELGGEKGLGVVEPKDWVSAKKMAEFLKHFYDITLHVLATQHVTSNIFFHEIVELLLSIREWCSSDDKIKKDMGSRMLKKYCKYWGNPENMNMLIFIGVALDPRNELWDSVHTCFHGLFHDYQKLYGPSDKAPQSVVSEQPRERGSLLMKAVIAENMKSANGAIDTSKTEAEKYLAEENEEDHKGFDILQWWKINSARFPILSRLARDVLAIPISTVASELAFSTGGRVLDDFRSSLTPSMVERLVCTQDWLQSLPPTSIEEDPEKLAQIEEELWYFNSLLSSTAKDDRDTIVSSYWEKLDPIECVMNHLNSVRLESKFNNCNMLEFACFLLARAQVLQIMRIQSKMCGSPEWVTDQRNLLSQIHMASSEAEIVFEDMRRSDWKDLSIDLVNALPDPFDSA
uniref:HAT C-terminal dimerisation domain-containing protein n=1 Tax=Oryza brachyantha TaxID=4533 RepID=J3LXK4_ORYBR